MLRGTGSKGSDNAGYSRSAKFGMQTFAYSDLPQLPLLHRQTCMASISLAAQARIAGIILRGGQWSTLNLPTSITISMYDAVLMRFCALTTKWALCARQAL